MIYIVCGLIMVACLIAIFLYKIINRSVDSESSFVFVAETVALVAFGVSWFTKGWRVSPSK